MQLVRIAYVMVTGTGKYKEDYRAWSNQDEKSWTASQAHFIEAQVDLRERQQTSCQGGYIFNNLIGIKDAAINNMHKLIQKLQ